MFNVLEWQFQQFQRLVKTDFFNVKVQILKFLLAEKICNKKRQTDIKGPFTLNIENAVIEGSSKFHRIFRGHARIFR